MCNYDCRQSVCIWAQSSLIVCHFSCCYITVLGRYENTFTFDPSYAEEIQETKFRVVSIHGLGAGEGFANLPEQCKGVAKLPPAALLLGRFLHSWGNSHPLATWQNWLCAIAFSSRYWSEHPLPRPVTHSAHGHVDKRVKVDESTC